MTGRRRIPWLRAGLFAAVVGWLTLMGLGFERLLAHGAEAGSEGAAVQHWPGSAELLRDPARASLVVSVHPRCPCTVATLRELARLAPRLGGRASRCARCSRRRTERCTQPSAPAETVPS